MNAVFYIAAAVAVVATAMVVTRSNVVHALLYLIVSLLAAAVVFYVLGAPFAAALEVIIYAGAIMVLFVFVVMMLNLGADATVQERQWIRPRAWIGPAFLSAVLVGLLIYMLAAGGGGIAAQREVGAKQVGIVLFGPYLLAVELASMLLLAGLVAAYHLGREDGG
ncbi:MAG TPA: NADH-quinone oxidoreductase subunit J [Stellaceae bacterium]|nr:NADH-quinone oxidoreductase subunit J [Stellaceae bacterium]